MKYQQATKCKNNNDDIYLQRQSLNICDKPPSPSPSSDYSLLAGRPAAATWKKQFRKVFLSSWLMHQSSDYQKGVDRQSRDVHRPVENTRCPTGGQKIIFNLLNRQGFCREVEYTGCQIVWKESSFFIDELRRKMSDAHGEQDANAPCRQLLITLFRTLGNIQQAHGLA